MKFRSSYCFPIYFCKFLRHEEEGNRMGIFAISIQLCVRSFIEGYLQRPGLETRPVLKLTRGLCPGDISPKLLLTSLSLILTSKHPKERSRGFSWGTTWHHWAASKIRGCERQRAVCTGPCGRASKHWESIQLYRPTLQSKTTLGVVKQLKRMYLVQSTYLNCLIRIEFTQLRRNDFRFK